jgi:hypothetical protein
MDVENKDDPWYFLDGQPLQVEQVESILKSPVWKVMERELLNSVGRNNALRDSVEISRDDERRLLGQNEMVRQFLGLPTSILDAVRTHRRKEIINERPNPSQ